MNGVDAFATIGKWLHPFRTVSVVLSVLVTLLCSVGLVQLRIKEDLRAGYTSPQSQSLYEEALYKEYQNLTGLQIYTSVVFIRSKIQTKSLLNSESLQELRSTFRLLTENFTVIVKENASRRFLDYCHDYYCDTNRPIWIVNDLAQQAKAFGQAAPKITFPSTSIFGRSVPLFNHFYDVTFKNDSREINSVATIALWFRAAHHNDDGEFFGRWERYLYEYSLRNQLRHVTLHPYGPFMANGEVLRGTLASWPHFLASGGSLLLFIIAAMLVYERSKSYRNPITSWYTVVTAVAALVSPLLACAVVFGVIGWLRCHLNSLMFLTPFLTLAIGVDDAFIIWHATLNDRPHGCQDEQSLEPRLARVLSRVGPSITVTSLSNCVAFGLGALFSAPEIQLYCLCTAAAMFADLLFQLSFFTVIADWCTQEKTAGSVCENGDIPTTTTIKSICHRIGHKMVSLLCRSVLDRRVKVAALLLWLCHLILSIVMLFRLQIDMDGRVMLPHESPLRRSLALYQQSAMSQCQPMLLLINGGRQFDDAAGRGRTRRLLGEVDEMPGSLGGNYSIWWDHYYTRFYRKWAARMAIDGEVVSYRYLDIFLRTPAGVGLEEFVAFSKLSPTNISFTKMMVLKSFANITTIGQRARLLSDMRAITTRYPELNATCYDPEGVILDSILATKQVSIRTIALTFVCVAVVYGLIVPNVATAIVASLSTASICLGVIAYQHLWGVILDPVAMASIMMAAGFSIDYITHICYHYARTLGTKKASCMSDMCLMKETMHCFAWPVLQAALSTYVCLIPLWFATIPAYQVVVKTVAVLIILGLLHGFLFVPITLISLPKSWFICCKRRRNRKRETAEDFCNGNGHHLGDTEESCLAEELTVL